jgi:hypothetical protein
MAFELQVGNGNGFGEWDAESMLVDKDSASTWETLTNFLKTSSILEIRPLK